MNRRRVAPELEPAAWPAFDTSALPKKQRSSFKARQRAVELYAANTAVAEIERRTGVDRRQLYRLLDHCVAPHDDGRAFGWRALDGLNGRTPLEAVDTFALSSTFVVKSGTLLFSSTPIKRRASGTEWLQTRLAL